MIGTHQVFRTAASYAGLSQVFHELSVVRAHDRREQKIMDQSPMGRVSCVPSQAGETRYKWCRRLEF